MLRTESWALGRLHFKCSGIFLTAENKICALICSADPGKWAESLTAQANSDTVTVSPGTGGQNKM